MLKSINPATDEVLAEYSQHSPGEVETILQRAMDGFAIQRKTTFDERAGWLRNTARQLRENAGAYGLLITREMGKPIVEAEAEVAKCAWVCDYYADNAEAIMAPQLRESSATESYVAFEPLGPVLAVMPWNFPFWQVFRFAAPAIMAGNTGLLKHASNVTGCALAIEEVLRRGGVPEHAFQVLKLPSSEIDAIISDDRVTAVTLTGSDRAGSAVASAAGREIKKTVLELGGSDPFIILGDARLDDVMATAVRARYQNTGQSCIATKRFIVDERLVEDFEERLVTAVEGLRVGDPEDRETKIGPMARADLMDDLHEQVQASIQEGAVLRTGGQRLERKGAYYAPTVLSGVRPGITAADDETFGPVAAVMRAKDTAEAIELANMTPFGLGASLWTSDVEAARPLIPEIQAGGVFVNGMVASDPRLPFGGIKRSGYGRELSDLGIREFTNAKTVWIGPARA